MIGYTSCSCGLLHRNLDKIGSVGLPGFLIADTCAFCRGKMGYPRRVERIPVAGGDARKVRLTFGDGTIIEQQEGVGERVITMGDAEDDA